jgi:ferritin-like metal-binding protein YciE
LVIAFGLDLAYTQHRKETQGQIKRLEKIFRSLGQKPEAAVNKLKAIASEFDVADEADEVEETEKSAEEERATSRR